ncbi:MAG: histidine phosphatase family protein [Pseudomonadota bacterium]
MTATRFWWIRHAVVRSNGVIYGQADAPADCGDSEAFAGLARMLPTDAVWVATPLQRTQQTARAIWAALDAPPADFDAVEPALMEQHFGDWQGRNRAEIHALFPEAERRFWLAPARHAPPGGESFAELCARATPVIEHLAETYQGRDVIVVAHGGTIRAALGRALGLEPEPMLSFSAENLSLTRIDWFPPADGRGEQWRVGAVNAPPSLSAAEWG